ncbi:NAD(P)-binding protein [Coccomyxa subellipsoidea C-169]|uniref:NAD(P)-binding protein n=1 Tax=Coccomyxa subellipsoidea (strain C-169) TaxID=574566 RepID=I0YYF4_COCSC|nr:NAD(P)-binding protein [Coccomyxa subellipsoidea C-169]EIE23423.1 NAD(P)-binding protein [Coccomyxa subellipsoidea C-169]|eukprot:XP_005647967.1 NAD(P)-binding protein [Coccomyxa subellipsoidea C-169]
MTVNDEQLVYVVTGASRGIGLEYVSQLLQRGQRVAAAVRTPEKAPGLAKLAAAHGDALTLVTLDVSDSASIKAAAASIARAHPSGIDVLINNAGIFGTPCQSSEQDEEEFKDILMINTVAPFQVIKALLPLIKKGNKKQIVSISSTMGSIGIQAESIHGGAEPGSMARKAVAYRASKAALNAVTVSLAVDLEAEGVTVVSMCPGWVATDMGTTASVSVGIERPPLDTPTSVAAQLKVIDGLKLEKTGTFFSHEGKVLPY